MFAFTFEQMHYEPVYLCIPTHVNIHVLTEEGRGHSTKIHVTYTNPYAKIFVHTLCIPTYVHAYTCTCTHRGGAGPLDGAAKPGHILSCVIAELWKKGEKSQRYIYIYIYIYI